MTKNVIEVLRERGFIDAVTSESVSVCVSKPTVVYCGFDPTSDSLHLGNLIPIMGLAWFQRFGHTPIALVGGATGFIGDPSGRNKERNQLSEEVLRHNQRGIEKSLRQVLGFDQGDVPARLLNNYDWLGGFSLIEFLRDVGKFFRMGPMLSKESVRSRLNSDEGMSFTEFTYQTFQGYDFLHLYKEHGVRIELGGSDQWGNIVAGVDLIKKSIGEEAFGLTFPLLTRSDGKKFGKSAEGAIWLDPERCSSYDFYQYLYRLPDSDVIKAMCLLTFMDMEEIRYYENLLQDKEAEPNQAQKRLAQEVTRIVHGEEGVKNAEAVTKSMAPGAETTLDPVVLEQMAGRIPTVELEFSDVVDMSYVEIAFKAGLQKSKGEVRRLIKGGGALLNNQRIQDEGFIVTRKNLIGEHLLLLGSGKKRKLLVRVQAVKE